MSTKVPTAEQVLALVTSAAEGGTIEPTMHQLLLQVQAQDQAQAQLHAHMKNEEHKNGSSSNVQPGTTPMDLMPLSAAAVVIGSPSHTGEPAAQAGNSSSIGNGSGAAGSGGNAQATAIKRKSIPLSMKKEAIEWIMGPGKGIPSRAEKHFSALNWDVSASSFRKWWKNREKILGDSSNKKRITGGGRKPYLDDSEEKLLVVVIQERAKKDRVTRKWIAKTAQHMFQRTNTHFKASENWVTKFIRRNRLALKRSYLTYEPGMTPPDEEDAEEEHRNEPPAPAQQDPKTIVV